MRDISGSEFNSVFRNPDDLGRSEYRAIYDTVVDSLFDGDVPDADDVITDGQVQAIIGILDEFKKWAEALRNRMYRNM